MRFLVRGTGFLVQGGFAWDPHYRPDGRGNEPFERLDGPWLSWTYDPF